MNSSTITKPSHSDCDSIAEIGSLDKTTGVESEKSAVFRQLLIPTKIIQASVLDIFLTNISKKDSDECDDFWIGSENCSFLAVDWFDQIELAVCRISIKRPRSNRFCTEGIGVVWNPSLKSLSACPGWKRRSFEFSIWHGCNKPGTS